MRQQQILAVAVLGLGLDWAGSMASAQETSQPPPSAPAPSPAPATANPAAPAAKDKSKTPATPKAPDTQAPAAQAPEKKQSTADDNPFPEEVSKEAAAAAKTAAKAASTPAAPTPGAKEADGSSSQDNTDKFGLDDPARKQLKLESPDGSADVYDPKRAGEDVRVGKFYLQTGYFKGAYDRFKDATSFDHENVEAVFWLAEAARKMNLAKEAEQNYELYLAAVPDGPNSKTARKALGELASNRKP